MNAIQLLKEQHNEVSHLFGKVKATDDVGEMQKIFEKIKQKLDMHTHIEETVFYPKLREKEELQDIVKEGIEEHHQAKIFLRELSNLTDESEKFEPKLKVLMEDVEHHVQEEEGQMFPKVEKAFDEAELEELGKKLKEETQNFQKQQTASAGK